MSQGRNACRKSAPDVHCFGRSDILRRRGISNQPRPWDPEMNSSSSNTNDNANNHGNNNSDNMKTIVRLIITVIMKILLSSGTFIQARYLLVSVACLRTNSLQRAFKPRACRSPWTGPELRFRKNPKPKVQDLCCPLDLGLRP